jgi:hypothetical protein
MACTSTIVLECKIPHELDALKWKAIGRRNFSLIDTFFSTCDLSCIMLEKYTIIQNLLLKKTWTET